MHLRYELDIKTSTDNSSDLLSLLENITNIFREELLVSPYITQVVPTVTILDGEEDK